MRSHVVTMAIVLVAPAVSACVLVNAPSNHESPPVAADDFCSRFSEVICDAIVNCCDQPAVVSMYQNRPMCVSRVATGCMSGSPSVFTLVHSPLTGYDAAIAGDVIAEARYRASQCDLTVAAWSHQRDGFLRIFPGTIGHDLTCEMGDPVAAGNAPDFLSCEDPSYACQLDRTLRHGTCSARVGIGTSCVVDLDCQEGLYCAPSGLVGGTCATQLGVGGACSHDLGDQGAWCQSGVCHMGQCQTATRTTVYCSSFGF